MASVGLVAEIEQVLLALVTEMTPLLGSTEQPVELPALKLTVPAPEPPLEVAVAVVP